MPLDLFLSFGWFVAGVIALGGLGMLSDRMLVRASGPRRRAAWRYVRRGVIVAAFVGLLLIAYWYMQTMGTAGPEV